MSASISVSLCFSRVPHRNEPKKSIEKYSVSVGKTLFLLKKKMYIAEYLGWEGNEGIVLI